MTMRRFGDRCALLVCATVTTAALAWLVLHPAAGGVLQVAIIAVGLVWRTRLSHRPPA